MYQWLHKQLDRLNDEHDTDEGEKTTYVARAGMNLVNLLLAVDRLETLKGPLMEELEAKEYVDVGSNEEEVHEHTLVNEEDIVEGVAVEVVVVYIHEFALRIQVVDDKED